MTVWALPRSLAATYGIDVSFSSSPYLDVSVQAVPDMTLCIYVMTTEVCSARFPHSDISGSMDICSSPKLFAAYHVFHRLLVPRHPPCALISLTSLTSAFTFGLKVYSVTLSGLWFSSFDIPFGISLGCLDIFFFEDSIFSFQYVVFKVHAVQNKK